MVATRKIGRGRSLCEMPGCRSPKCNKHESYPRAAEYELYWAGLCLGAYCVRHHKEMVDAWLTDQALKERVAA